ncbi:hypothetical protein D3C85_1873420 [compost metagenome]
MEMVQVVPATKGKSAGTFSSFIRTGTRCARRTQGTLGFTSINKSLLLSTL